MNTQLLKFLILATLTSCTFMKYMDMEDRDNESIEEIISYLHENDIFYDYSFLLVDSLYEQLGSEVHHLNTYKFERGTRPSGIQLRVFDREGKLENAYSQCFGPFDKLNILATYPTKKFDHLPINYNLFLDSEFDLIQIDQPAIGQILNRAKKADYTLILYWSKWSQSFSMDVLQAASKYKFEAERNGKNIVLILVNTARDA